MENGYEVFALENFIDAGINAKPRQFNFIAKCDYVQNYAFISVSGVIRDKYSDRVVGVLNAFDENTNRLNVKTVVPESQLADLDKRDFVISATFKTAGESEDGENDENYCETASKIEKEFSFDLDAQNPIKVINVIKPIPKTEGSVTRIVYGKRCDPNAAYKYEYVNSFCKNGIKFVPVYIPFEGSVTVVDELEICEVDVTRLSLKLFGDSIKGVVAYRNDAQLFSLSDDRKMLVWHFHDNWNNNMELHYLSTNDAEGNFDLRFFCPLKVRHTNTGVVFDASFEVTTLGDISGSDCKTISKLSILWGCLAKGTGITLNDDSVKPIESITKGEKVKTKNGCAEVKEVITGSEKEIVAVQTQDAPNPLLLSKTHIIATRRGEILACEMNAADDILMQTGEYSPVTYLEIIAGEYDVYSLELETPDYIYADGMLVGSHLSKISKKLETAKKLNIDPDLRARLIKECGGSYVK
jgi:hypothetical protein